MATRHTRFLYSDWNSHLPGLGALAIILGAAADPFAQQLVHLYEREYTDPQQAAWVSKSITHTAIGPYISSNSKSMCRLFPALISLYN